MTRAYRKPNVSVDVVLLTLADKGLMVALHRRTNEPFRGALALPGGYIHVDEDDSLEDAARRTLLDNRGSASKWGMCRPETPSTKPES